MTISTKQVAKFLTRTEVEKLQVEVNYPFLVIFETSKNFRIVNLEDAPGGPEDATKGAYELQQEIIGKTVHERFLWILMSSEEIFAIDLTTGYKIKLCCDSLNYKICRFLIAGNKLFVVSEGGDCLNIPCSKTELQKNVRDGVTEIEICLEKVHLRRNDLELTVVKQKTLHHGLDIYPQSGDIIIECPTTGLRETMKVEKTIEHVISWEDALVVGSQTNMWLLNIGDANILHEFSPPGTSFYPLIAYNGSFYYLQWDNKEIQLNCAWNTLQLTEDSLANETLNKSTKVSSEETLKTQLLALMESANTVDSAQVLPQLKPYFEAINDFHFLIENGSKLCQLNLAYKTLLYSLQKRISEFGSTELSLTLQDVMIKVDLLEYISFRSIDTYDNAKLFEYNFKQLCATFLSKSDFDLASICWMKYSEMKLEITPEEVLNILNSIPANIKMSALIIWLRNFVPALLAVNPYFIDLFVRWTSQRVFSFEQSGYWPKIGLKFIDEIVTVLESSLKTVTVRPISMDDLDVLKDHLNYIMELRDKYKINMLLGEISSQQPSEVALIMLRRCYTEDLEAFLQNYLPSYAGRYQFEVDDTLRTFVENEAASCGGSIDSARLQILLNAFRSPTTKLDCLLQVLKVLDVPWDDTVLDLALTAAALVFKDFTVSDADRQLAHEIQKELNYAKVKVVLKKYKFPLTCNDYLLVLHKVINALNVDLNDLKVITGVMPAYANYGNTLYIDRCLRDCETRVALDYFANLNNKEKRVIIKTILTKYEQIITRDSKNPTVERNYLDFLKRSGMLPEIQTKGIENLYHLKNSYDITLSLNDLYSEDTCYSQSAAWISKKGGSASSAPGRCLNQLTKTIQSRQTNLIALLRRTSTSNKVRKLIETLISAGESSASSDSIITVLNNFKDGRNTKLLLESLDVLIELVTNCAEEYVHFVAKYLAILNALISSSVTVKNLSVAWKFHYIFLPMSSVAATNSLIEFFGQSLSEKALAVSPPNFKRSDFISFRMIAASFANRNVPECSNAFDETMIKSKEIAAKALLSKVIASQDLDSLLVTNLLLITCGDEGIDENMWIIDALQGQHDSLPPTVMSYLSVPGIRRAFALDHILSGHTATYPPQHILKTKFNINLGDVAFDGNDETWDVKVVLLNVLRQCPNTSFDRLVELCSTLNVPINDGLSLQLISLLCGWELKYKIVSNELGCRNLYLENDESDIMPRLFTIWESLEDKEFLRDVLNDFWKNGEVTLHGRLMSINPYYYELYLCIYQLIFGSSSESRTKREYFLLNYLKEYQRHSSPRQYEFELFSAKGMFPEIGHYRLPFQLFMREDMWANLKSEITLETYERWLPAVALLSLDADLQTARDMVCSNALKQTMTSRKRDDSGNDTKDNEPWRLTTREEPLLRAAHRCVRHIANMEWAGACLFYVLQGCARGADQVAAAKLCYQFAQRWAALQPGNKAVRQMERMHSTLSTRHALHKIEWARDEFVKLSNEPSQLIRALYLHPDFVEKMARHDVNRAANEIADKNGINISSIRIQILENIISQSGEDEKNNSVSGLDTKKLMTAKHILKATCPKMGAIYLSRIAFDEESDFNKHKKLRALQILMSFIEQDTAMKVTNREREALWESLLELLYTINLESIDMPWLVATFTQDKIRAVEQLVQASRGNVEALKIAADLARRFGNTSLVRDLIPLLLRAGLHEELIPLLMSVNSPPDDLIYTAWRAVIVTPFQRADYPITERQKAKCLNAVNLLPVCPVTKDEDLIEIWKNCIRCKCFGLGCLVLPYVSPEKRQSLGELQRIDKRNLIASLKNLHSETYLVPSAMQVVEGLSFRNYRQK